MEASGNFSAASGKRPLLAFFAAESKIQSPAALLPAWGLIRQPRSPKRLGHRVAAGGPGIDRARTRLAGVEDVDHGSAWMAAVSVCRARRSMGFNPGWGWVKRWRRSAP